MMRKVRSFTKKADPSWSGDSGTGILAPDYMGLGFGSPGGGGEGLGNQINLPPSHQGHPGNLAAGPWSGDSNIRERFTNEVVKKEMPADWTPEGLISEIKNLLKINTPESRDKAMFLKDVLDDKVRRMKASRRTFDSLVLTKNAAKVAELKQDVFVQALFVEHNIPLENLDEIEVLPEELSHFALHNLVHSFTKQAQALVVDEEIEKTQEDVPNFEQKEQETTDPDNSEDVKRLKNFIDLSVKKALSGELTDIPYGTFYHILNSLNLIKNTKLSDKQKEEVIAYLNTKRDEISKDRIKIVGDFYSLYKLGPDSWISALEELKKDKRGEAVLSDMISDGSVIYKVDEDYDGTSLFDLPVVMEPEIELSVADFYDFYMASLIAVQIFDSVKLPNAWKNAAAPKVVASIDNMARKICKAARIGCCQELQHLPMTIGGLRSTDSGTSEKPEKTIETRLKILRELKSKYGSVEKFVKLCNEARLSWDDLIYWLSRPTWASGYGGKAWVTIAKVCKDLEEELPVTTSNLTEVVLQVDHAIDLEHNSALFLREFVDFNGFKEFLTQKTNEWTIEFLAEKSPELGQIYNNLKRFAKVKKFTKQAQSSQQPIKGECPESEKVVYVSISDLVENDFKADCPEGKRHLEHVKPVSIKEYVKHKKHKKKATELQPLKFTPGEQEIVGKVRDAAEALDIDIYLVGGFIRDRISSRDKDKEEAGDLDFMCEHDTQRVVQYLVKKHGYKEPVEYSRSKAIMLNMDEHPIDFIDAKRIYRPLETEGYSTLEEEEDETVAFDDAFRRDLTVNALMYDVRRGELLDPTGRGIQDLKEGVLNTIIDPFIKFRVHAPDMLRALRFAATLGFKLGPNMLEAMRANAERVRPRDQGGDVSNRRVRKELRKAIDKPEHWAKMRELLQEAGLDIVLAEDIEDVQQDFEGSIEYTWDDEKSKLIGKQKEEKAMVKRFTKKAADDRVFVGSDYYLLPLSSKTPITGYSLVRKDPEKKQPDKVVGFVSLNPNTNAWTWEPTMSDRSYGKFSNPRLAADDLIKSLASIRGFTKQSGMFDWLVGKKPPTLDIVRREEEAFKKKKEESKKGPTGLGTILPASKAEQVRYLARKIDQQLLNVPAQRHEQFVLNTLTQYKIGKFDPRYVEILSLLQNYGKGTISKDVPPASREVEWRD